MRYTYTVQTTITDEQNQVVGTLTRVVKEQEDGKLVVVNEAQHTFGGDFFEVVENIESVNEALDAIADHLNS